jgi:hypothetical protein
LLNSMTHNKTHQKAAECEVNVWFWYSLSWQYDTKLKWNKDKDAFVSNTMP